MTIVQLWNSLIHMLAYMYQWFQWWRYTRERFQIRIS